MGMMGSSTAGTQLPSHVGDRLEEIASQCPRYLNRVWTPNSGGDRRLNTPHTIITHAILNRTQPSSIHDVSLDRLTSTVRSHLRNEHGCESMFSSWTQSFHFAWTLAEWKCSTESVDTVYISIVDTKRLPSTCRVLYTPALGHILGTLRVFVHEFLCFGAVAGDAHYAIQYGLLRRYGGPQWPRAKALFMEKVTRADVPVEWRLDSSIMTDGYAYTGPIAEAYHSICFLREMVEKMYGVHTAGSGARIAGPSGDAANSHAATPRDKANAPVTRVPPEVLRLYIDMVGWEHPENFTGLRPLPDR
ncbi:uncharacterized protein LTR77_001628 [Saxophila tyrrhenica]|uniref:DUF7587 domain-containing protein n=1 Tax=Saxophila tyrrhenica TaxID=1690608 RepID=A0AAV9PQF9_9PEZI|nr:hypothetical protein LTR77_001628 [Saxophila tyrrhenica]